MNHLTKLTVLRNKARRVSMHASFIMVILCIIPNMIRAFTVWLDSMELNTSIIDGLAGISEKIRFIVPLYWCAPFRRLSKALSGWQAILLLVIALLFFIVSVCLYSRRNLASE